MDKHSVLREYFGHSQFRSGQAELIDSILSGRDALGIMPTGAGKSICYQVPAMLIDGITLVISPLISLMKDQVNSLVQSGIRAAYINSSLTSAQYAEVMRRAYDGMYKIIYAAPERLSSEGFISFANKMKIAMITVDEAHCISQWGQDFRPDYRKIVDFINRLSYRPIISAFTATATPKVRDDIIDILRMNDPFLVTTGFDRTNLYFGVIHPKNKYEELINQLRRRKNKCGIIYCISRKNVEEVCEKLCRDGFSATRYHAGLSDEERHANQDDFLFDRRQVMVATNAFGMGIDKSNVSFVIHYNMPKNLESYYQEAGRAGRDGEPADCVLLYSPQDVRTNRFLIENSRDLNSNLTDEQADEIMHQDELRLKDMTIYCTTTGCLREFILKYFGDPSINYCGNCSNCLNGFETVDITVDAQKIVSCVYRIHQRGIYYGRKMVADILKGSRDKRLLQLGFDKLSTYNIMSDSSLSRIRTILDHLIREGYLSVSDDKFETVMLNARSAEILRDRKKLEMKLPIEKEPKSKKKKEEDFFANSPLFSILKKLRREIADREQMPAFVVFSDAALKDMCRKLPTDYDSFLDVSGVGTHKAEKYSEAFCDAIRSYIEKDPAAQAAPENAESFLENDLKTYKSFAAQQKIAAPWTHEEDEQLRKEISNGMNMAQIALAHDRTISEISLRIKKL